MTVTGMLAAFTMVIASTIVNVAVPDVIGAFGVSQSEVQLMATAFNIAMTTGQLLNAWAVSVFGQASTTAYAGVERLARPEPGETLVVSAAASTVGGSDFGRPRLHRDHCIPQRRSSSRLQFPPL